MEPGASSEIPEADAHEQGIPVVAEADDASAVDTAFASGEEISGSIGDRIDADPADVLEQLIAVHDDEDRDRADGDEPATQLPEDDIE